MKANPIYENVEGAPFKIGDKVVVTGLDDEDAPIGHGIGEEGIVVAFEYECGCGQTYPSDPMILVLFLDDNEPDEFWREELCLSS